MSKTIKIGTRGSKLALWQAEFIKNKLLAHQISCEIVVIETKGDKILDQPFAEIGTKGIFTEEIESKLLSNEIHLAVHSAKDMQSTLPQGLEILAFTEREKPNDVVVSLNKNFKLDDSSMRNKVGTSSARRKALLNYFYPHITTTDARGNLQTRVKKLEDQQFDAMILAYAGIVRMDYDHLIVDVLPIDTFVPAVGQGSIAVEISSNMETTTRLQLRRILNDDITEACLKAERSFLATVEGGCSIPVFGNAVAIGNFLTLTAGIVSPDGKKLIKEGATDSLESSVKLGQAIGQKILNSGGREILKAIDKY
ncbi:MAG TPA: hydroxymethylbilane synthase [Cytophagaceae bacterium]|jgi:hydroxymethylbilane synthase